MDLQLFQNKNSWFSHLAATDQQYDLKDEKNIEIFLVLGNPNNTDYVLSHTLTNNLNSFKLKFENLPNSIFQFRCTIAWTAELKQRRTVPELEGMTKVSSCCSLIKFGMEMCWLCNNGKGEGWSKSRLVTDVLSVWTGEREKQVWLLFGFSLTSDLCIVCIPTRPHGH